MTIYLSTAMGIALIAFLAGIVFGVLLIFWMFWARG